MLQDSMQPLFVAPLAEDPLQAATMQPIPVPHESAPNADEPLPEAIALNERLLGSAPTMRFVFIVDACSIVLMVAPYSAIRISSVVYIADGETKWTVHVGPSHVEYSELPSANPKLKTFVMVFTAAFRLPPSSGVASSTTF